MENFVTQINAANGKYGAENKHLDCTTRYVKLTPSKIIPYSHHTEGVTLIMTIINTLPTVWYRKLEG